MVIGTPWGACTTRVIVKLRNYDVAYAMVLYCVVRYDMTWYDRFLVWYGIATMV